MTLSNIVKLSETVWELWPAQDYDFSEDKYIMKNVRVAYWHMTRLLAVLFIPTKYESNPLKNKGSI